MSTCTDNTATLQFETKMVNTYFNEATSPGEWTFGENRFCCVPDGQNHETIFSIGTNHMLYVIYHCADSESGYAVYNGDPSLTYACVVGSATQPNQAYAAREKDGTIVRLNFDPQNKQLSEQEVYTQTPFVSGTLVHKMFNQEEVLVLTHRNRGAVFETSWCLININQSKIYQVEGLHDTCYKVMLGGNSDLVFPQTLFVQNSIANTDEHILAYWGTGIKEAQISTVKVEIPKIDRLLFDLNFDLVQDPQGLIHIVATASNSAFGRTPQVQGVFVLKQISGGTSAEDPPVFDSNWSELPIKPKALNETPLMLLPRACFTATGEMKVMVAGAFAEQFKTGPYRIFHAGQNEQKQWSPLSEMGMLCQDFAFLRNAAGQSVIYTFENSVHFSKYWQDNSEIGLWNSEQIEVKTEDKIISDNAYFSLISVLDSHQDMQPQAEVHVQTKTQCTLQINGQDLSLEPNQRVSLKANLLGQLNIYQRIAQNLSVPTLTFHAEFLPEAGVELQPERDVHAFLSTISEEQLKTGTDSKGQPIIPADKQDQIPHVQKGIKCAMSQVSSFYGTQASPECTSSFGLLLEDGKWVYRKISTTEMQQRMEEARTNSAQVGGFFDDVFDTVGSAFESVWEETAEFTGFVWEGTNAIAYFLYDGVKIAINKTLDLAESALEFAFAIVRGVLNVLGTVLGVVIGWLLKMIGFLFGWDDILKNRDKIKEMLSTWLTEVPWQINVTALKSQLTTLADDALKNFDVRISDINQKLGQDSLYHLRPDDSTNIPAIFSLNGTSLWPQTMSLVSRVLDFLPDISLDAPELSPQLLASIKKLIADVEALFVTPLAGIYDVLTHWFSNIEQFASDGVPTLIDDLQEIIKNVLTAFLQLIPQLIEVLSLAIQQLPALLSWLDQELDIPFFTPFYKYVLQSKLSLFDLMALVLAVPLTLAEKLNTEQAENAPDQLGDPFFNDFMSIAAMGMAYFLRAAGDAAYVGGAKEVDKILGYMSYLMMAMSAAAAKPYVSHPTEVSYWAAEGIDLLLALLFLGYELYGSEADSEHLAASDGKALNIALTILGLARAFYGGYALVEDSDNRSGMLYVSGIHGVLRAVKLSDWPNRGKAAIAMGLSSSLLGTIITVLHGQILKNSDTTCETDA